MDDDVARIDQNPVAVRQALDLGAAQTLFLQRAQKVVGERAHVAVRAARGHDHAVGHGRLAPQVDQDDVLGLVVVQLGQQGDFKRGAASRDDALTVEVRGVVAAVVHAEQREVFGGIVGEVFVVTVFGPVF